MLVSVHPIKGEQCPVREIREHGWKVGTGCRVKALCTERVWCVGNGSLRVIVHLKTGLVRKCF